MNCYKQFCSDPLDILEQMNTFFQIYNLPKLNHKEIENVDRQVMRKNSEYVIRNFSVKVSKTRWLHCWNRPNTQNYANLFQVLQKIRRLCNTSKLMLPALPRWQSQLRMLSRKDQANIIGEYAKILILLPTPRWLNSWIHTKFTRRNDSYS